MFCYSFQDNNLLSPNQRNESDSDNDLRFEVYADEAIEEENNDIVYEGILEEINIFDEKILEGDNEIADEEPLEANSETANVEILEGNNEIANGETLEGNNEIADGEDCEETNDGIDKIKCEECGQHFSCLFYLEEHKEISHNREVLCFTCNHCGKKFKDFGNLMKHKKFHPKSKPFKCIICFRPYNTSGALKIHEKKHFCESYCKCEECGLEFFMPNIIRGREEYFKSNNINSNPSDRIFCNKFDDSLRRAFLLNMTKSFS